MIAQDIDLETIRGEVDDIQFETLLLMQQMGFPLTRERYLQLNFAGNIPDDWENDPDDPDYPAILD